MLNHRKTPGRSGRRFALGGAMFAALALAFSAISVVGVTVASAVELPANCVPASGPGVQPQDFVEAVCYSVGTQVASVDLGQPVQDTATVTTTCESFGTAPTVEDGTGCLPPDVSPATEVTVDGTVTFRIYHGCDGNEPTGSLVSSDGPHGITVPIPGSNSVLSDPVSGLAAGDYSYVATFGNDVTVVGPCEPFTVDPVSPSVSTTIQPSSNVNEGTSVFDSATVGGVGGFTPTGTVSFTFYDAWNCGSTQSFLGAFPLESNGFTQSVSVGAPAPGEYSFLARYNGDSNYIPQTGVCENLTVNGVAPPPVAPPQIVLQPVIVVQPAPQPQPQVVEVSPATAVAATGTFTG